VTATGERGTDTPGRDLPPPGLAGLYAALEHTAAQEGFDAIGVAVDDPDLGRQVFAAGADAAAALAVLGADPDRDWWATPTPDEPPAALTALLALAAAALRLGLLAGDQDPAAALEIAIRSMPGVAGVRRRGSTLEVAVHEGHRADVLDRLSGAAPSVATVVVLEAAGGRRPTGTGTAGASAGRAELVAVRSQPETGEVEVHLRLGDRRTVGRGPLARSGAAAVTATLEALTELDPEHDELVGLRVGWVRTIDTTPNREFLVAVSIRRDQESPLYGLASGASPIEAAARAALHACNRAIGRDSAR